MERVAAFVVCRLEGIVLENPSHTCAVANVFHQNLEIQKDFPLFESAEKKRDLLREEFRRLDLLNEKGTPKLSRAIGYFCNDERALDLLEDMFCFWRDEPEFMVLRRSSLDPRTFSRSWEYVAVKCSKRGNNVYVSRMHACMQKLRKDKTMLSSL